MQPKTNKEKLQVYLKRKEMQAQEAKAKGMKSTYSNLLLEINLAKNQLKKFSIYVGESDQYIGIVNGAITLFNEKGLNLETMVVPGGHTWMNCKLFLATTLPQLFK